MTNTQIALRTSSRRFGRSAGNANLLGYLLYVCINTPDHTHFNATLAAMERGIHVCTQKPLTHDIWQARTLRKAKQEYKVVTNMANQGHTYDGIRQMREMYEAGLFGDWFCHVGDGPAWVLDLYEPTVIECVERGPALEGMITDHSVVRYDFPARGEKEACSMYWYDGMRNGGTLMKTPEDCDWGKHSGSDDCYIVDSHDGTSR